VVAAWALPIVALLMLALTLTPAEIWNHPATDAVYRGFDPKLVYVNNSTGTVNVGAQSLTMKAPPSSEPSVNLVTTTFQRFDASLDATVLDDAGSPAPFRIGVWSPRESIGYFIVFESVGIVAETEIDGRSSTTLVGATQVIRSRLTDYVQGAPYHISFSVDKAAGLLRAQVSNAAGIATGSIDKQTFPVLFGSVRLALSASAAGGLRSSHVILQNWHLSLPHQRFWASKVADTTASAAVAALLMAGLLLIVFAARPFFRLGPDALRRARNSFTVGATEVSVRRRRSLLLAIAIAVYLVCNALLFPLGGHPFDYGAEKLYAYVANTYGAPQLFYLPNTVSLAGIWNGIPYSESAFPYDVIMVYLFGGIGWLNHLVVGGASEYTIKAVNVLFGLADAALIYWICRRVTGSKRLSVVAGTLFLFNPAVWFSMSVWGQTHVISLFFVLAAVLFVEKGMPFWAWLALAAACLTRPQMLVFGLLLAVVLVKRFSLRQNLVSVSWVVILTFILSAPLTLAIGPSLPFDILLNNLRVQEAGGNDAALTTVSQGAYSIWPLLTYFLNGASGMQRAIIRSSTVVVGPLTYQLVAQILTVAAIGLLVAILARRKRSSFDQGGYVPIIALGVASFLMLLTGGVATHFLLALPFFLLCRRWVGSDAYFFVALAWTITTLVTMFGDMGLVISTRDYPFLAPENNAITRFMVTMFTSDKFISVGVTANICAVAWLAIRTFRRSALQTRLQSA
jgi:hypothetical protein